MNHLESVNEGEKVLYSDKYFSGDYNHEVYLKKSNDDGSHRPKMYISAYSRINGELVQQGYIYFYLNYEMKSSEFIGIKVMPEFRDLNIGSFLMASWIDLCLNNKYDFLGVNHKQRKPFLLYLLKTYGFEVFDTSLYKYRPDVISICRHTDPEDKRKFLLFKDSKHEQVFKGTNIYKTDNYEIVHHTNGIIILDNVILPLQNASKNYVDYYLQRHDIAQNKVEDVISRHTR